MHGTGPAAPVESRAGGRGEAARDDLVPAPRPLLGGLAGDPRLPIWIARAVLAIVAGGAITAWQGWRLGVTAAAFVAIADTIYRSKTTSLVPAAVRVGSAQLRTGRRLFLLRPHGHLLLHNRATPATHSPLHHPPIPPRPPPAPHST